MSSPVRTLGTLLLAIFTTWMVGLVLIRLFGPGGYILQFVIGAMLGSITFIVLEEDNRDRLRKLRY